MNQKLVTVLFLSVFYYGVTYSSPLDPQNEGMGLPEEKPPTEPRPTTQQINKKIEAVSTSTISPSIQHVNTSKTANLSSQTIKESTGPGLTSSTTESHQKVTEEVLKENINNKTKSISSGKVSNESTTATSLPASSVIPTSLPTNASNIANSPTVAPAPPKNITNHNSTNTNTPAINTSTTTRSPEGISNATNITNNTNTINNTNTTTNTIITTTTIKPSTTTNAPVSANKDNVAEHNTPAPIQEKHFDGQSFIGGMALTIGLTAIGFIAFKYYKSGKIDMNYRTL